MRIYNNFSEALNETQRDLAEMGVEGGRLGWQGKDAGDRVRLKELRNYGFTVQNPSLANLTRANAPWCEAEFKERITAGTSNPGNAYKLRPEVWEELLESNHRFAYTYSERMNTPVETAPALWWLIQMLREDPTSRRAFLPVYFSEDLQRGQEGHRVPCTLGYNFIISESKLHITYLMRSSDFFTHFQNDLYLATKLQRYIADQVHSSGINAEPGEFTFFTNNLHVFARDVEGVF